MSHDPATAVILWGSPIKNWFIEECLFDQSPFDIYEWGGSFDFFMPETKWRFDILESHYTHRSGEWFNDHRQYFIGIKISEIHTDSGPYLEDPPISPEQISQYQKKYEELRNHVEMLFGETIPSQGKLCVIIHD